MIKTSTDSDIVKYIYNQFNNKEKIDFESKLLFDSNLNNLIEDYYFIIDEIEKIDLKPNKKLLKNIMSFSKSYVK
ncbi:MAG: hypothetical protein CL871_01590 [Cytophagia bacterium]|nr:hypothetical protein [Cytophagia bacterium]|tara:strand:- start:58 stop:282 length:225 start_codon:yes stop_codon:yes gene_type:complete